MASTGTLPDLTDPSTPTAASAGSATAHPVLIRFLERGFDFGKRSSCNMSRNVRAVASPKRKVIDLQATADERYRLTSLKLSSDQKSGQEVSWYEDVVALRGKGEA